MLYLVCQKSIEFLVDSNFTDVFVLMLFLQFRMNVLLNVISNI